MVPIPSVAAPIVVLHTTAATRNGENWVDYNGLKDSMKAMSALLADQLWEALLLDYNI